MLTRYWHGSFIKIKSEFNIFIRIRKDRKKLETQISEEDSKRITSLRFLLIVFVVFIHANLTPDDALNYYHYDFMKIA